MTDCFQPCELQYRTTYQTIQEMNLCRVSYLIVTKSALPAAPKYLEILDKELAHIQITVTCLDDAQTAQFEKASHPSQRIRAIQTLQAEGYDVAIRLSPIIEEKIHIPQKTICEDVTEHYQFWRDFVNPNKEDCCNLRKTHH